MPSHIHKHSNIHTYSLTLTHTHIYTQCTFNTLAHSKAQNNSCLSVLRTVRRVTACSQRTQQLASVITSINLCMQLCISLDTLTIALLKTPDKQIHRKSIPTLFAAQYIATRGQKEKRKKVQESGHLSPPFGRFFFTYFVQSESDASIDFRLFPAIQRRDAKRR